jgi:small subunit ribosomal protein S9
MADLVQYYGTGRRKSAIARVFLRPGTGEWKVNGKAFEVYFVTEQQRVAAKRTLALVELASTFDVVTTVRSGGVSAQADAVKLGVARALIEFNPELRKVLKAEGLLTRDSRMKERKKYGQKGALFPTPCSLFPVFSTSRISGFNSGAGIDHPDAIYKGGQWPRSQ